VGSLKETDRVTTNSFWIGVYPGMKKAALEYTSQKIHDFVKAQ
jgi:CDP-6-deoxy-D-xylo-4-hexulose-3-dehydrase